MTAVRDHSESGNLVRSLCTTSYSAGRLLSQIPSLARWMLTKPPSINMPISCSCVGLPSETPCACSKTAKHLDEVGLEEVHCSTCDIVAASLRGTYIMRLVCAARGGSVSVETEMVVQSIGRINHRHGNRGAAPRVIHVESTEARRLGACDCIWQLTSCVRPPRPELVI